ncbi:hypothetical protein [Candidatus Nitrospira bockiana]
MTIVLTIMLGGLACTPQPPRVGKPVSEEGLNVVRVEADIESKPINTHPVSLTPAQVATILRGVRAWERRNIFHRLVAGEATRTRAFRDEETAFLAPALSRALSEAGPADRVYFHLSRVTESGEEETTTGWLFVRDPLLYLVLSEVHDRHGPGPDISRYDRRFPDIPEESGAFNVTFEPEHYLESVTSRGGWFSAQQREELAIRYREALPVLPRHQTEEKS